MIIEGLFQFHMGDMERHHSRSFAAAADYDKHVVQQIGEAFVDINPHILIGTQLQPIIPEQVRLDNIERDLKAINGKKVRITIEEI